MRKTLITLTVLLALAALVPAAFASGAAAPALAAAPTALNLPSPANSPSQPDAEFALWLQAQTGQAQTAGQIATPSAQTLCPYCWTCFDTGYDCCLAYTPGCYCCFL